MVFLYFKIFSQSVAADGLSVVPILFTNARPCCQFITLIVLLSLLSCINRSGLKIQDATAFTGFVLFLSLNSLKTP